MYAVIHIIDQGDNCQDILTEIEVQIAILILGSKNNLADWVCYLGWDAIGNIPI